MGPVHGCDQLVGREDVAGGMVLADLPANGHHGQLLELDMEGAVLNGFYYYLPVYL